MSMARLYPMEGRCPVLSKISFYSRDASASIVGLKWVALTFNCCSAWLGQCEWPIFKRNV